jgi:hypothetical protein
LEEVVRERAGSVRGLLHEYKWSALSCTSLGALIATINGGTLIIALSELAKELHAPLFSLVWVILGYMLAQTALFFMAAVSLIGFLFSASRGSEHDPRILRESGL